MQTCSSNDMVLIRDFFTNVDQHCSALPQFETEQIRIDFENAILYLTQNGLDVPTVLKRLSPSNMGGFYTRQSTLSFKLDDAAKVYPLTMSHGKMVMFRLSMNLKKMVVPEILQMALNFTIKRFPTFATEVKKGFFWHYLNSCQRRYGIFPEEGSPCRPIKIMGSGSPVFRLLYYHNRISVEFFHIVTDGMGGFTFLKTLVTEYFRLLGIESKGKTNGVLDINEAPIKEETENAFSIIKKDKSNTCNKKASILKGDIALQMSGKLSKLCPCQVLHFKMDATKLKELANKKGATVTAYMLSKMFLAGQFATEALDGDYITQVLVDLRKYYPHKSLLNFSLFCNAKINKADIKDDDNLIANITEQLKSKASKAAMTDLACSTSKFISSIALFPLFMKIPVTKIGYSILANAAYSNVLSSVGVITMPPELMPHIENISFILGNALIQRTSCTLLTFNNIATFSISKNTTDPTFEEQLYRLLQKEGLDVQIERSPLYEC